MNPQEPFSGIVIAIDGPSGSGKSTVARGVATRFGLRYLDTGALYRAVTWLLLERGVDTSDPAAVAAACPELPRLSARTDPSHYAVQVANLELVSELRTATVSDAVSPVSAIPQVRALLLGVQRHLIGDGGVVVEGRDIGTVIAPNADVKVFLIADEAVRVARRTAENEDADASVVGENIAARDRIDSGRTVAPLAQAEDAVVIDASDISAEDVIDEVSDLVLAALEDEWSDAGPLSDNDSVDDDWLESLQEIEAIRRGEYEPSAEVLPVVAILGRPNVGKSSLVNRIVGRREAVVEDVPGVTRDRVTYEASWAGKKFILLDTGGWEPDATGRAASIARQAENAVRDADVAVLVVDSTVGMTDADEAFVRVLRKSDAAVVLAANKVDDLRGESDAATLWALGLGEPYPVSALHGRGSGDLLDAIVGAFPATPRGSGRPSGLRRVALLGRPNVGKSSLLNRLAGEERVVVDPVAGTTVDPVDEVVEVDGRQWLFVDTAGIRRKAKEAKGHEYYAVLRTQAALDRAEVAVVLLDASDKLAEQDVRMLSMVEQSGRALVIAFNKWDLVDDERQRYLTREIELQLEPFDWAPRLNISALNGRHVDKLAPHLVRALEGWESRIPTARLNAFLGQIAAAHPHPVRGGKQPRILFATQAGIRPPHLVLFSTGFLEAGYRRFLTRRLREEFGFDGSPLVVQMRIRTKRERGKFGKTKQEKA